MLLLHQLVMICGLLVVRFGVSGMVMGSSLVPQPLSIPGSKDAGLAVWRSLPAWLWVWVCGGMGACGSSVQ